MTDAASPDGDEEPLVRIRIRNVWHMFVYAWELLGNPPKIEAAVEQAPRPSLLFASVLAESLEKRMRLGLPRAYVAVDGELGAIRGRLDVLRSIRAQAFERGRAYCRYEAYSVDSPRNRIIRGTLARLLSDPVLWAGTATGTMGEIRRRLERCDAAMIDVAVGPATRAGIRRERPGRNDPEDRLVLALCELILEMAMPAEISGPDRLLEGNRDARLLRTVFERFVARFLDQHLSPRGWRVEAQRWLDWPVSAASDDMMKYLPRMQADIVLTPPASKRRIIIDTKFTDVLARGRTGNEIFKSAHLYQLYAYVQTQAASSRPPDEALLLYPAIRRSISEYMELQGQKFRLETVDLAQTWPEIERTLVQLVAAERLAA